MAQVKTQRASLHPSGAVRSHSSSSIASSAPRPRRININLPKHAVTAAAFLSPDTGTSLLTPEKVRDERARYADLVAKNATSEALLKMPNVVTKPRSTEETDTDDSGVKCKIPTVPVAPLSNHRVSMDISFQSSSSSPNISQQSQRPSLDRRRTHHGTSSTASSPLHHPSSYYENEQEEMNARRSSMNPLAASFTPIPKQSQADTSASNKAQARRMTVDSKDSLITGLGITSPADLSSRQQQSSQPLSVNTRGLSSNNLIRQDRPIFITDSPLTATGSFPATTTGSDFNPEEFRNNIMQQISDKLETDLDRHFSQLVSATSSLPLSPATSDFKIGSPSNSSTGPSASEEATILQLRNLLRHTNSELDRLKDKNQELREVNHKLELKHLEAVHQVSRLQDFELNNQFLQSRVKELEASNSPLGSSVGSADSAPSGLGQRSINGANNHQISKLMQDIASLISERDALKIRAWELEKKPFSLPPHEARPAHFVDLENERSRLIEELGVKTVAMEELWNKNEALMVRAKEYEKRVWELEGQVAALEAECAALPRIRSDLVEMEARAVAADALVDKLQDMEGQVALVKNLQDRIQELETTNAELDHSNWDLSERLNIANNQHALLSKEFESFRSKDKDDRRIEFLTTRNRELETLLAEQSASGQPDFKAEFERASSELEKIKIRMPQLEGQAKQVALLRSKTLHLEKQIKTMEQLEPRLEEMQQLHERNLFLEGELGELEHLRAREMELEHELEDSKARLIQLETNKTRLNSFSGLKQLQQTRGRSGSVAQHGLPPLSHLLKQPTALDSSPESGEDSTDPTIKANGATLTHGHRSRPSLSLSQSMDALITEAPLSPCSPQREFPAAIASGTTSSTPSWPSGRSSMSMSHASHRMSTSSSTSTLVNHGGGILGQQLSFHHQQQGDLVQVSQAESAEVGGKEVGLQRQVFTAEPEVQI
ncbi:hypothetical protein EMPS_04170 [Entomortierella parvispora]|uniref:Uncharacterized protein n=1 Tax=Entomortierella parvispora TaxID=205924 RepID=A0A9P3LV81_9FUNG|nr:hypothetical protein EMPS_04170 [Entomortierella parvispora]